MPRLRFIDRLRESPDLWPPNWPIRRKLTGVTAGITFVVLVAFGLILGQVATQQIRDNFAEETLNRASALAAEVEAAGALTPGFPDAETISILDERPDSADLTLVANGYNVRGTGSVDLGPITGAGVSNSGGLQIGTVVIEARGEVAPSLSREVAYVRFGRQLETLERQVANLWLLILAGTLGASLLAGIGAAILCQRALGPLGRLTRAAGRIAVTRDPDLTLPEPDGEDEVVELTRSFNEMLHELSLARRERERSLSRQREFVADASHELRTPLTSILANLELLGDSGDLDPASPEREAVESALRSGIRMKRLVSDLQILARADSGRAIPTTECDLGRIADEVMRELAPISEGHDLVRVNGAEAPVEGVRDDLHRMILNLVDNAFRHTPEGSRIEIRTGTGEDGAWVTISDDGEGIPDQLKPAIFDRFIRSNDSSDRSRGTGSGLGLSIVSAIAREHGGSASVSDAPSGGALFRVDLPLADGDRTVGKT